MKELVGVAISTYKRPAVLAEALSHWATAGMPDVLVVVNDDAGDGVAATKNRCITALMDAGCEHLFLADDDIWPLNARWARTYTGNDQPHLMHCWGRSRFLGTDEDLSVWSWPRGPLLYVTRNVVDIVGGMRTDFHNAGEHAEWSRRIYNCGFTKHPFADIAAARRGIWHALDYKRSIPSTLGNHRWSTEETEYRQRLYEKYRSSTDFVEYRT